MTDQDQNLRVVVDHINKLAEAQQRAADKIMGANRYTGAIAGSVGSTHGLICMATKLAVADAEEERSAAGKALFATSTELAEKLTSAANNYNNVDYMAGKNLGQECRM
jgi:hypothetical protein